MDLCIEKAREKIKNKCLENNEYVINEIEAYILICQTADEVVKLYVYKKLEERIKNRKANQEDLMNICTDVFGEKNPISSVIKNMKVSEEFSKETLEEYKDIFESFKKDNKKKM